MSLNVDAPYVPLPHVEPWKVDFVHDFACAAIKAPPRIVVSPAMVLQRRFPRSKRRRIREKWRKRTGNFGPDLRVFELLGPYKGTFICHPLVHNQLLRCLRDKGYIVPSPIYIA